MPMPITTFMLSKVLLKFLINITIRQLEYSKKKPYDEALDVMSKGDI